MPPTTTSTWSCAQCSSAFDKSKLLEHHALTSSHKAYKCTQCPKAFGKRPALIRHNTTHSDVKAHACRACGKAFYRKDHCAGHEEVCTHRLAVETKARLSTSLAGSPSTSNKKEASETTSPEHPREETIGQASESRKRYREVNGDGDQSRPSPTARMNNLSHNARQKPQQPSISDPETRHKNDVPFRQDPRQNMLTAESTQILQQYPALRDIDWGSILPDAALESNSMEPEDLQRLTRDSTPDSPAHLMSMEPSIREASPRETRTLGTHTCTFEGCMQRFGTAANLQKHTREVHRTPSRRRRDSEKAPETAVNHLRPPQVSVETPSLRAFPLPSLDMPSDPAAEVTMSLPTPSGTIIPDGSRTLSVPHASAFLPSMGRLVREASSPSTPSFGTSTCTYHGCTRRFDNPTDLQRHKQEVHWSSHLFSPPCPLKHYRPPTNDPAPDVSARWMVTEPFGRKAASVRTTDPVTEHFRRAFCGYTSPPPEANAAPEHSAQLLSTETSDGEQSSVDIAFTPSSASPWTRQPRVVVVEYDQACRRNVAKFLQDLHCSVETVFDGSEAMDKIENDLALDLVLTGAILDGLTDAILDGVWTRRLIRQMKNIPVVVMASDFDEVRTYSQHAADVLLKPVTKDTVLALLEMHLQHLKKGSDTADAVDLSREENVF